MGSVTSTIFQPRPYNSADLNKCPGEIKIIENITVCNFKPIYHLESSKLTLTINILYCHGNGMNVINSSRLLMESILECADFMNSGVNMNFNIYVWEYPTYTISKQTRADLEKKALFRDVDILWQDLTKDSIPGETINMCIGASIGSVFACSISNRPNMDILLLQCPIAKLPSSAGYIWTEKYITGEVYNNLEELEFKHPNVFSFAVMSESDDVLQYEQCKYILPYLDHSHVIGQTSVYKHSDFFKLKGFKALGVYIAECILQHSTYKTILEENESMKEECPDDKQEDTDCKENKVHTESP